MTTLQKTLITATVVLLAGVGIYEARQASQLRDQVQTLRQQQAPLTEQIQQLQQVRDDATNRLVALADELAQMKSNSAELLKLRGQGGFSRRAEQESARLTAEREDLTQRLLAAENDANVTRSNRLQQFLKIKKEFAEDLGSSVSIYWAHHQRRMPASFEEALAYAPLNWEKKAKAESNGISLDQFEFIGNEYPKSDEDAEYPLTLILREKQPVQRYDGKWVRVYVDSASGARVATSTNGDFNAWERDNMVVRVRTGSETTGIYKDPE